MQQPGNAYIAAAIALVGAVVSAWAQVPVVAAVAIGSAALLGFYGVGLQRDWFSPKKAQPAVGPEIVVNPIPNGRATIHWTEGEVRNRYDADCVWLDVTNSAPHNSGDAQGLWAAIGVSTDGGVPLFTLSPARWRHSKYPWEVRTLDDIPDRIDLRAGETRQLDFVFRPDGSDTGHGLTTDATQYPGWVKPGLELPPGRYRARVRISAANLVPQELALTLVIPRERQSMSAAISSQVQT